MLRLAIRTNDFFFWRWVGWVVATLESLRIVRLGRSKIRWNIWRHKLAGLGKNSVIYSDVVIHSPEHVRIGENVSIAEFVHMWGGGGINIGDDVMIASHAVITSQTHDTAVLTRRSNLSGRVEIESNVWIGAGAIILPGVTVGKDSVVAAGAVVASSVPERTVVAGVPASILKRLG